MVALTTSTDPAIVARTRNVAEVQTAVDLSSLIDQQTKSVQEQFAAATEIQKAESAAELMRVQTAADLVNSVQQETAGTAKNLQQMEAVRQQVQDEFNQVAMDKDTYSFFSNPIATIRGTIKRDELKSQLNDIVSGMNAGYQHIDLQYAKAAQKLKDFDATVMAKRQVELESQSKAFALKAKEAQTTLDLQQKKLGVGLEAARNLQDYKDPKEFELWRQGIQDNDSKNLPIYQYMHTLATSGDTLSKPMTTADLGQYKLQLQLLVQQQPDVAMNLLTTSKLWEVSPYSYDKNLPAEENAKNALEYAMQVSANNGSAAAFKTVQALAPRTPAADIISSGFTAKQDEFVKAETAKYIQENQIVPGTPLKQDQLKAIYQKASESMARADLGDIVQVQKTALEASVSEFMKQQTSTPYSAANIVDLVRSKISNPKILDAMGTIEVRNAIELPKPKPGITDNKLLVSMNMADALLAAKDSEGKSIATPEEVFSAIATYQKVRARRMLDTHPEYGRPLEGLRQLSSDINNFSVPSVIMEGLFSNKKAVVDNASPTALLQQYTKLKLEEQRANSTKYKGIHPVY
jgi:hypothetical protein